MSFDRFRKMKGRRDSRQIKGDLYIKFHEIIPKEKMKTLIAYLSVTHHKVTPKKLEISLNPTIMNFKLPKNYFSTKDAKVQSKNLGELQKETLIIQTKLMLQKKDVIEKQGKIMLQEVIPETTYSYILRPSYNGRSIDQIFHLFFKPKGSAARLFDGTPQELKQPRPTSPKKANRTKYKSYGPANACNNLKIKNAQTFSRPFIKNDVKNPKAQVAPNDNADQEIPKVQVEPNDTADQEITKDQINVNQASKHEISEKKQLYDRFLAIPEGDVPCFNGLKSEEYIKTPFPKDSKNGIVLYFVNMI